VDRETAGIKLARQTDRQTDKQAGRSTGQMKHVEYGTLGGVWATNARLAQRSAIHPSPASLVLPPPAPNV